MHNSNFLKIKGSYQVIVRFSIGFYLENLKILLL